MRLHQALGLSEEIKRVVSLCGAGGKTTLLYALAREARESAAVAVFTTTHIYPPEGEDVCLAVPFSREVCRAAWQEGKIAAAGTFLTAERKFGPPSEEAMAFLCEEAQAVFIEADGSRRLPLKYPAPWEPVLRPETSCTVAVAGLGALDREAEETVHRFALAREALGIPTGPLTEESMAAILWAGYGRFDPVFLLNQADDPELERRGMTVAEALYGLGARRVTVLSLRKQEKGHP